MGSKGKNETVSGVLREYVENADKKSRDYSFKVGEICDLFASAFRDYWTDEDNYKYRLNGIIRQVLNQLDFYSLGDGEYYDVVNGTDSAKKELAMNNHRKDLLARTRAINRLIAETKGQLYMVVNELGELEIKEA